MNRGRIDGTITVKGPKGSMDLDVHAGVAIEQDGDVLIFTARPEIYTPTPENEGLAEIIIGKQRNGPTGNFNLHFHKAYTRFTDLQR